tara:strand:- start:181 stop:369 length:189 start_codon:yes stop_codon:yes gene_type:complete
MIVVADKKNRSTKSFLGPTCVEDAVAFLKKNKSWEVETDKTGQMKKALDKKAEKKVEKKAKK